MPFFVGLFLLCAGTLMYEIVLTRLLSVISWYYLAFVSVSLAMFGMTAGALAVQLRPDWFPPEQAPRRLAQATWGMALALPVSLLNIFAVPLPVEISGRTAYSFLLFSAIIATPFLFAGVAVCLALTRSPFPIGRVYFVDLLGAAAGCFGAVVLLNLVDGPSAVLAISAVAFAAAGAFAAHAGEGKLRSRSFGFALAMVAATVANASTMHGLQPVWVKGKADDRAHLLAEVWNPISKVRVFEPVVAVPIMWGPSPNWQPQRMENIFLDIDHSAGTNITRYSGDPRAADFLRFDVTSLAAQLRPGGSAAIIGVGGGRDVLAAANNGFRRIVGIEVNPAIVDLVGRRLDWFAGLSKVPGLELHADEGRSFLTRSGESFDVIQASLVDTWAATSAGAMTLSENSLYTVNAWRLFWRRLKPGGLIAFSRWNEGASRYETLRMVSLARATLVSEGVQHPLDHLALLATDRVATLLLSNAPLTPQDVARLRGIAEEMGYRILLLPGQRLPSGDLVRILAARDLRELSWLRAGPFDISPVYDDSPFFFSSLRLSEVHRGAFQLRMEGNLLALSVLLSFMAAAGVLLALTVFLPLRRRSLWTNAPGPSGALHRGIAYFLLLGLAFLLVEIAMMQQLSIFLGHPVYALLVVLAGLIFFTGLGSLASEKVRSGPDWALRWPALAAGGTVILYSLAVLMVIERYVGLLLWQRVTLCLLLMAPCGFFMGFCFPLGMRRMREIGLEPALPWMWALNGGASVMAGFVAILLSMEASISVCVRTGAMLYLAAALLLPVRPTAELVPTESTD
jgi:SAM-dependent methyltransferase